MKLLKRLALVVVVGLVLVVAAAMLLVPPASRAALERGGRYALGVETTLEGVGLSPGFSESSVGFRGLEIGNPDGMGGEPFLDVGDFSVGVRTLSLVSGTVRVPVVELDGLHLRLIQDGERSNFREILAHARGLGGGGEAAPATGADDGGSAGPTLALGRVSVKGVEGTLELRGLPGGLEPLSRTFRLPDFDLDMAEVLGATEGGGDGDSKATVADLVAALTDRLIELGVAEASKHVDPQVAALLQGGLDDLEGALKSKASQEAEGVLDDAQKKLEDELGGGLKGLLKDG